VKSRYYGVVLDSLPHSLYIARWILGDVTLVGSATAKASDLEIDVDDVAGALLRGPQGQPCYLLADYLRDPRQFYVRAVTSGGVHEWELSVKEDVEPMYRRQMEVFCNLAAGEDVGDYPNLADGIAVQEMLDAIRRPK
jgi:predicted dehydrogenase